MQNHMTTLELQNSSMTKCKDLADNIQNILTKNNIQCQGAPPCSAVETSPTCRPRTLAAKDGLRRSSPSFEFQWCERSLEAWNASATDKLGFVAKSAKDWVYNAEVCKRNGVVTPMASAPDDEDPPAEQDPQADEIMAQVAEHTHLGLGNVACAKSGRTHCVELGELHQELRRNSQRGAVDISLIQEMSIYRRDEV